MTNLTTPAKLRYTAVVTSNKGVAGIGVPNDVAAKSRSLRKSCGFSVLAPSFGGPNGEPKGSPANSLRCVTGTPTRSGCLPQLALGVAVFKTDALEAGMARPTRTVSAVDAFDILFPSAEIKASIEARRRAVVRALAFRRPLDREQLTDLEALRVRMGCELAAVDAALRLCGPGRRTNRGSA